MFCVLQGVASADPRIIDRTVALVNGQVITLTELDREARVLLIYAGGIEAATAPLELATQREALDEIISDRLLSGEAEALGAYPLEDGELESALRRFKGRFATQAAWQEFLDRHDADEATISVTLSRFLRAQHVLDGKLRLKAQVSEAEARKYLDDHKELAGISVAAVRQKLFADRFKLLARTEVKQARKNARVRMLGPFLPGADVPDAGAADPSPRGRLPDEGAARGPEP
jgi:hypothetical protein